MNKFLWAGALALASLSSTAMAQDTSTPEQRNSQSDEDMDVIVVTATGLSTASSATKTRSAIIESPQSISIISREEFDIRGVTNIADALAYSSGVQANPSGIDSRTDEISIRGFGAGGYSSNNSFVDGLRLPSGGGWTRFGFDAFGLQQIEVLKGPSSVLYGQTAPGGIVNIVSKRPTSENHGEFLLQGAGYTDLAGWSQTVGADIGGSLNEDETMMGRVVGLVRRGETQIDDVENNRYYFSPSFTWKPSEDTSWTLLGQYQRDTGGSTFQFLPSTGAYVPSNGQYIANDANIGEPDWNSFNRSQLLIGSFLEHDFSPSLKFRNNMRYTHVDTYFLLTVLSGNTVTDCTSSPAGANCIPGQTVGRRAVKGVGESDGFAIDNQLEGRFMTGEVEHTLLGGIDFFHTQWDHERDLVSLPGLPRGQVDPLYDIFNPVPRGIDGYVESMAPQIYGEAVSKQVGVYIQDQIKIDNWRLTLGGRYDRADDENVNTLTSDVYNVSARDFTWRAGAVYMFDNGFAPYASYSQSFLPQLTDPSQTLGGVLFEPTTGQQYEAGLRYQSGRNIYMTLGAFQINQQNVPTADANGTLCGRRVCQVQAGAARVRGIEFEGRASFDTGTTLIVSASHLDGEVTESNDPIVGNKLTVTPRYTASVFVDQKITSGDFAGTGFGGGIRHTGESYGDTNNLFLINSYTLFDLFVRYDFGEKNPNLEGLSVSLNARNLADKRYVATCSTGQSCFYGEGRVVTARLQYKW